MSQITIVVGTYDGVLAGWEASNDEKELKLTMATPVHQGSVRSLALAAAAATTRGGSSAATTPATLLSCGYDEMLKTHDLSKRINSSGEVRTPSDFGTPTCSAFAPPPAATTTSSSTHCLVGFVNGKIALYKRRDWSIQHVLGGHEGGVSSLAVHPSGKLALSGGQSDGKIKLWDLLKGRLAHVTKIHNPTAAATTPHARRNEPVTSLVWNQEGTSYGWCHGNHLTVRHVDTGNDSLDVELPSRINQICLLQGSKGTYCAAAGNDGSLAVLQVLDEALSSPKNAEVRAIMAIEPVDRAVAGEERFKCIQILSDYQLVTANSAGVVSWMDISGAVNMIMTESDDQDNDDARDGDESDENSESNDDDDMELAVEIIDSARLGSGARITCLAAWHQFVAEQEEIDETSADDEEQVAKQEQQAEQETSRGTKRKASSRDATIEEMDATAVNKARKLVKHAKEIQKKKKKRKKKLAAKD